MEKKIFDLKDLGKKIPTLKKRGKKVVHCHGVFDILHAGHIKHFNSAKKLADILVVTVTHDQYVNKGPNRPIFKINTNTVDLDIYEKVFKIMGIGLTSFFLLNFRDNFYNSFCYFINYRY